ncbi:nuclear transport factor 2 family protein [Streptomyces sp. URMC 123]|uniref:nuclear transport factor 2 family protein n=1 Tax=Streptomyces sp. URMC 123 TaxID=3423403 RepID=UPI003F1B383A
MSVDPMMSIGTAERQSVQELLAAEAARQCVIHERWARDIGDWDEMAKCYYDDTRIAVGWASCSGAEFIEHTKKLAATPRGQGLHQLGPIQVQVNGNRAFAELPAQIVMPVQVHGLEAILYVWERMCFRVEKRVDDWRIAEFKAVYLKDYLTPDRANGRIEVDDRKLDTCRPSYRYTQYWSIQAGWGDHPDRPGIDRPETVREVYDSNEAWLHEVA